MCRWFSLFFVFLIGILYVFSSSQNLVLYAKNTTENIRVLNDDFGEELIVISEDYLENFLHGLNLQNKNIFKVEDRIIIEGYSNKIRNSIKINNKKINVQISIFEGECLIGSPFIKNSFWLWVYFKKLLSSIVLTIGGFYYECK